MEDDSPVQDEPRGMFDELKAWYRDQRETLAGWLGDKPGMMTLVFSDIVDSTHHLYNYHSGHYMYKKALQLDRARLLTGKLDCKLVDAAGDSMFFAFRRPSDGLAFARRLFEPSPTTLPVRIGIHHGRVNLEVTGLAGRAVHYAARVCDKGDGAELWVSEAARNALENEAPAIAQAVDWGRVAECELSGIPGLQQLWQIGQLETR